VFFIVLDLRLTKVWGHSGDPFFYFSSLFLLDAEQETIVLNQLPHEQERVDGNKSIADQCCHIVALGITFLLDEDLIPERSKLSVVLLETVEQLVFPLTNLVEGAIFVGGFLNR